MNIRDHVRSSIAAGLAASWDQRDGKSGVTFHDENEFIPFDDLNYNDEYGYYRMSQLPDLQRDCTNENPETLHWGKDFPDWKPIIWADSGGNLTLVGDIWQAADLYQALHQLLRNGVTALEEVSENDPAWDYMKRIDWAVKEYRDFFPDADLDNEQIRNSIRAAAKAGRIRGCSQDDLGNWHFRPVAFRGWLVKTRDEKRGRPRKSISDLIENFTGDTSDLQRQLAAMTREATGQIPRGQLWQSCEEPGCENEPVCMNCLKCQERHCHCFD